VFLGDFLEDHSQENQSIRHLQDVGVGEIQLKDPEDM
jgi:hypothetical protein